MSKLNIMVGAPGAGKSYYLYDNVYSKHDTFIISRDDIRFRMLKEGEEYFAHEKEVFKEFVKQIQKWLNASEEVEVYADATHLTASSRFKLLANLHLSDECKVNIIYIKSSLDRCLRNNAKRDGIRNIPEKALIDAYNRLSEPSFDEYDYNSIITVEYNDK